MDGNSGINDNDNEEFSWESDDDEKENRAGMPGEACEAGPSQPSLYSYFIAMGFSKNTVEKAIKKNGEGNSEAILETLLTYSATENPYLKNEDGPIESIASNYMDGLEDDSSDTDDFDDLEFIEAPPGRDRNLLTLVEMGFSAEEASAARDRCGLDASVLELADSIHAAHMAKDSHGIVLGSPIINKPNEATFYSTSRKKRLLMEEKRKHRRNRHHGSRRSEYLKKAALDVDIPKPMIGFSLPFQNCIKRRNLPDSALGPPYFYYENVALAPKGVWDTISRFLYDIEPEFVDSKYFCAAMRKRAYIHNLPIENRFPLLPLPKKTIQEALPTTKKWWPEWDNRTQLNCLQTCTASAKLTEKIKKALDDSGDVPSLRVQEYVLAQCKKWNLVWVGRHKAAPLEPDEIEMLLRFPKNHTRGGGIGRTERFKSLGNSFQIDTVAYHLSVLKNIFPDGINVLSLFSGIGGAEVALHSLGIRLKAVVSVEISEVNRNIIRCWWEQTNQKGTLIEVDDVQKLDGGNLEEFMRRIGGFDLVIGGSPCNNLTGSNRHTRDGLEGKDSSLFYDFFRILDLVKCIMGKKF
ncbi:hypothetical protein KFK09_027124 [Dendrobium nobile]|uniref:DNA (cytosine-5-)-methyltransferase n=1 Tax=Dendrobium nobile TaxID=94219 RepID=A0A8T3A9N3_DENNO|nr:hypothetical protein KFK09_027124 [Dendrobium nobile]